MVNIWWAHCPKKHICPKIHLDDHTVRNFHFLSKNTTLISWENCHFFRWKTRENVVVFDFLAVDNFDFTRKIVKKIWVKELVKMLGFGQNWIFGQKLNFRIVWKSIIFGEWTNLHFLQVKVHLAQSRRSSTHCEWEKKVVPKQPQRRHQKQRRAIHFPKSRWMQL